MRAHVRGWEVGARVECYVRGETDVIEIRGTHGSNARGSEFPIATLEKRPDGGLGVIIHGAAEDCAQAARGAEERLGRAVAILRELVSAGADVGYGAEAKAIEARDAAEAFLTELGQ
jgi:hypothetical protein